jgi:hypothetical protein
MPAATQERTYNLGKVAPITQRGADYLGNLFGIKTIGGYRAHGSVPNSDHPKGLAADFMTNSKSVGDKLANFAVKHFKELNIKYVIWWGQIWRPGKGWEDYHGPSDHKDHVHVSFNDKGKGGSLPDLAAIGGALVGSVPGVGTVADGLKGLSEGVKNIAGSLASVGKVAELVTQLFLPNNLVRGAAGLAGTLFILIGIFFLSREARN